MTYRHLLLLALLLPGFSSCGKTDPSKAPVINTPAGAKVDLSKVSMDVSNARITRGNKNKYVLDFDYTVHNHAGANITFLCLYNEMDDLIEVNLTDKEGNDLVLGKRLLDGLTLTEPRTLRIPIGETTRSYTVPLMPELREKGDPISVRIRLHAPSRYDELRSSVEAPDIHVLWP
jgi:hypothetical protein